MKILFVTDQYFSSNNGTAVSSRRFARVLQERGHEVRIASCGIPEDLEDNEAAYLMGKMRIPVFEPLVDAQGMTLAKTNYPLLEEGIRWADVVHFFMPFPLEKHGLELCIQNGTPYTAAFHVQPENISYQIKMGKVKAANDLIYAWMNNYFYKYVKHVHCPSRFIARELMNHGFHNTFHVISNGIDPDFVYGKAPKRPEFQGKFVILSVGRYSPEKRQDVLLDAVRYSKYAGSIQVVLAGQGPEEKKLRRMGSRLANEPLMHFFTKEELLAVMAESDLYVHCAQAEIEAMACMEAFARGLVPVIADSPKSATPQFALTPNCLFRPGDAKNLAKHIDYFIEHENLRKNLEKKYAASASEYRLEKSVIMAEEMFEAAIKGK